MVHSRRVRHAAIAAAVALALVVTACGGGAEPTAIPAPTATRPAAVATAAPTPTPILSLAATATPTPAGVVPKYGGILQARMQTDPLSAVWDTYLSVGRHNYYIIDNFYSNLMYLSLDDSRTILPDLARSWELSQDGTAYTLHLQQGVQWHDGKPFTSADVLWNLDQGWKPTDPARAGNKLFFSRVARIEAPDQYTVKITLDRPSASFLASLSSAPVLMYPAHVPFDTFRRTPMGTGPFKVTEVTGSGFKSVRNDKYWHKDEAGRSLPYVDGIFFHSLIDQGSGLAAFRTKRIDCGCGFDQEFMTTAAPQLRKDFPDWQPRAFYQIGYLLVNQRPPFDSKAARQALMIGFDRKKFQQVIEGGLGFEYNMPAFFFYQPDIGGQWGLPNKEITQIPGWRDDHAADLALAKQTLRDAGLDPGQSTVSFVGGVRDREVIKSLIEEIGFRVELKIYPLGVSSIPDLQRGIFDIAATRPAPFTDDPSQYFTRHILSDAPDNYGKWSNPVVDKLFLDIDIELDPAKRRVLAGQLQRELLDWAAIIPTSYLGSFQAPHSYVKGYKHAPFLSVDNSYRMDRVWLDK